MCPLWSETATGYTVLVLEKKEQSFFFPSPDYLIYTRTGRVALYVYNIVYITHAYPHPPRPYYICRIGTYPVRRSTEPTDLFRTSIFLLHTAVYRPRRASCVLIHIIYLYVCTAVAGGKFYRRTGRRLPVFGAEAAAAVICARVRRRDNNSLSSVDRHFHRRRLYLYRIHDRRRKCHITRVRRPERDHDVPSLVQTCVLIVNQNSPAERRRGYGRGVDLTRDHISTLSGGWANPTLLDYRLFGLNIVIMRW